jgi:hypothetical protein
MKLDRRTHFEIDPVPPYSFRLTVRKPAGWDLFTSEEVYGDGTLWTGIRFASRPFGLKIESLGTLERPRVLVGVYAAGYFSTKDADSLRRTLDVCLGAEQDLKEFYAFATKDGILKHVVEDLYGMHDTQAASLCNSVILSICLQMARLRRSYQMMEAIDRKYGQAIEFDGKRLVLQPMAERIAKLDPKAFADECKLGYRAKYIVASAKMIAGGFPDMQEITRLPPDEAKEKLMVIDCKLDGRIAFTTLNRPDVLNVIDLQPLNSTDSLRSFGLSKDFFTAPVKSPSGLLRLGTRMLAL